MRIQMPWFPPLGLLTALFGSRTARMHAKDGGRHGVESFVLLALAWFPMLVWLLVQIPFMEK